MATAVTTKTKVTVKPANPKYFPVSLVLMRGDLNFVTTLVEKHLLSAALTLQQKQNVERVYRALTAGY